MFLYDSKSQIKSVNTDYGSELFKEITKFKSRLVLEILLRGYHVTWTDTDIIWFQNPIPYLNAMESDFVVQSNAPLPLEEESNGSLRINSGFYRVRSTPVAIAAMKDIVAHAYKSKTTEQPSFYVVLCGGEQGLLAYGGTKCLYTSSKVSVVDSKPLLPE